MPTSGVKQGNTTHKVEQGDTLVGIAHQYGFRNWEVIWSHAQNQQLRSQRDDPQVLSPGDEVFIPEKQPKEFRCETRKRHTFKVRSLKALVRQVLEDEDGKPYAGKEFKLVVDGQTYLGKTDSKGLVEQEVPAGAKQATLTLWPDDDDPGATMTWTLQLGHLDPIDSTTGQQARLNNLGYDCGSVDGQTSDALKEALLAFQRDNKLPLTGEADAKTLAKLEQVHDRG